MTEPALPTGLPRVSVVVPVYNGAGTLEATLASVWAQTFQAFEVLVINDASTDGTGPLLARQADVRLRVLDGRQTDLRSGVSAGRNRGVAEARGEFVAFLDGDDLWTPDKLARQVAALDSTPLAALAYSWTDLINGEGRVIQQGSHTVANGMVYPRLAARNFLDCGSTPLIRRRALHAVGGFDESLRGGEDWDLWLRIAADHGVVCVPAVQVLYRVHPHSAMANVTQQVSDVCRVITRAVARLPPSEERAWIEQTARANLYKYVAVRLAHTAASRSGGITLLSYLGKYLLTTPEVHGQLAKVGVLLAVGTAITLLPPAWIGALRKWHARSGSGGISG